MRRPKRPCQQRWSRKRLHRRIFLWFGASILVTGAAVAVAGIIKAHREGNAWHTETQRAQHFLSQRLAYFWFQPDERDALAAAVARDFDLDLRLYDRQDRLIGHFGQGDPACRVEPRQLVERDGELLGSVSIARPSQGGHRVVPFFVVLFVLGGMLWAASGAIARRIVRPLVLLEQTARNIGEGNLKARVDLGRHHVGEVGVVAEAINDMADRIEKQMADQRELLAAVSHEMRTPLGHMRLLVEIAREEGAEPSTMDELEKELVEADALIGELLASSKVEFAAIHPSMLSSRDVALRALERRGLGGELLRCDDDISFEGDATLVARALANLLENADRHGGGLASLGVCSDGDTVTFEAHDSGPGFAQADADRAFESFVHTGSTNGSSIGLGLALVKRIAQAHGGQVGARSKEGGGAVVWLTLPTAGAAVSGSPDQR